MLESSDSHRNSVIGSDLHSNPGIRVDSAYSFENCGISIYRQMFVCEIVRSKN